LKAGRRNGTEVIDETDAEQIFKTTWRPLSNVELMTSHPAL
jgi:hypothetical protein